MTVSRRHPHGYRERSEASARCGRRHADDRHRRPAALSATELLSAYAARTLSPVEVLRDVADIVSAREPTLNALWVNDLETRPDALLDAARASERRWADRHARGPPRRRPRHGQGEPRPGRGADALGQRRGDARAPARSSPVVERVEEAGGLIIGSTVMPDWGMLSSGVSSLHGTTRSPWDHRLTTGGSSAGAGAAAAAGYGPLHVGTDIGGSIRLPGTWLGLTTLKPSAGRVPLDTPYLGRVAGPMTRTRGRRGPAAVGDQPPRLPRLDRAAARAPRPRASTPPPTPPCRPPAWACSSMPAAAPRSTRRCGRSSRQRPASSRARAPTIVPLEPFMTSRAAAQARPVLAGPLPRRARDPRRRCPGPGAALRPALGRGLARRRRP